MRKAKPFNLFVYGTLMNPSVFRAVTGLSLTREESEADGLSTFQARPAVLDKHKKVSFDNTYQYAIPDRHGRIRGYVIGPLPAGTMTALREYEGRNYSKRTLRVQTKDGPVQAVAFLANLPAVEHSFGYSFRDPLKQEVILARKIEDALVKAERQQLRTNEMLTRRALRELHGSTIRDLVRRHFDRGGISDYAIQRTLEDDPLRDFERVVHDPEARALAPNYLRLVIRQVLFNQYEENVRRDFRYELDHLGLGQAYYERTLSDLTALRMLNASGPLVSMLVEDCLSELEFGVDHLVDFVRWAVIAADSLYNRADAKRELNFLRNHLGRGYIPMGMELEFSNIGHGVIADPRGEAVRDSRYDSFMYFRDFGLDVLTWKLGGHVDDHHDKSSAQPRRGFFELAPGNLSIPENLSKPITNDPWLLNQFIHQARRFFPIAPHSVHISLQLRSQHKPSKQRAPALAVMKCLFAVGGDLRPDDRGRLRILRLTGGEIITRDPVPHMLFSEISVRRSTSRDEEVSGLRPAGRYVQQFRFLRLSRHINYEPVVLALKGIQIRLRPGSFLLPSQYQTSRKHRRIFEDLAAWGHDPTPLSSEDQETFLQAVREGLMTERRGQPAHGEAYIAWALGRMKGMLDHLNAVVEGRAQAPEP